MACVPESRSTVRIVEWMDMQLLYATQRYAEQHGVMVVDLIEAALVTFMCAQMIPVKPEFCAEPGCALEVNSSGTTTACPIEEGAAHFETFIPDRVFPQ
jgi:hypothetical protein